VNNSVRERGARKGAHCRCSARRRAEQPRGIPHHHRPATRSRPGTGLLLLRLYHSRAESCMIPKYVNLGYEPSSGPDCPLFSMFARPRCCKSRPVGGVGHSRRFLNAVQERCPPRQRSGVECLKASGTSVNLSNCRNHPSPR